MGSRASRMVKSGPNGTLVAAFSATLLTLMLLLAMPAEAQDTVANDQYTDSEQVVQGSGQQSPADASGQDDSQATTRAATDPAGETARVTEGTTDTDDIVDRIVVPLAGCEVASDASVVVADNDGTNVTLTNNQNVTITPDDDAVTIEGADAGGNLTDLAPAGGDNQFGTVSETVEGELVSSEGITCGRDGEGGNDDNDGANAGNDNGDNARTADELRDLGCEELLVLFRAGSSGVGQYGNVAALADADVQARIEVCLRREVVQGTASDGDLPNTGGVSLVGLAVLGLVSAAAGLSVIRGGRRRG